MKEEKLTKDIIGCAYRVFNKMGFGFLESVYENCMLIELKKSGLNVEAQKKIDVYYDEKVVGVFRADMIVNGKVIVELKAVEKIHKVHEVQLVNYLTATGIDIGLIVNFGKSGVEVKRKYRTWEG